MHKTVSRFLLFAGDAASLLLAFIFSAYLAAFILDNPMSGSLSAFWENNKTHISIYSTLSVLLLFAMFSRGYYRDRIPWWGQVQYILLMCAVALILQVFMHLWDQSFSRLWAAISWASVACFILLSRRVVKRICDAYLRCWKVDTYIIGNGENVIDTLFAVKSDRFTGYDVKQVITFSDGVNFDDDSLADNIRQIPITRLQDGQLPDLPQDAFYIFALNYGDVHHKAVESLMMKVGENGHPYTVVPPSQGLSFYESAPQYFFGHDVMFLSPQDRIHSPLGVLLKRGMDISGALLGMLMLSPVFLVTAFLIKKDGGPAFFGHTRVGKDGKPFKCWKFRSMVVDAEGKLQELLANDEEARKEWEKDFKLRNDPRISKVGKFIREKSIDELPQLWNVLKGEMSLVGPRPIVEKEQGYYGNNIKQYLSVRPGVTGLWQASGRNDTGYKHRVYLDTWYVENWHLFHDIVIILKTIYAILKKDGAY